MKTKRSAFNLIELTLAIAVVGIGIASVMALFIPAIDSTKNSIADNYTADVVNTFASYLESVVKKDSDTWNNLIKASGGAFVYQPDNVAYTPPQESTPLTSWVDSQLVFPGVYGKEDWLYGVKVGSIFFGHLKIWAEQIKDFYVAGSSNAGDRELGLDKAARIYFELSWPVILKYEKRNKRLYVMELYSPYVTP